MEKKRIWFLVCAGFLAAYFLIMAGVTIYLSFRYEKQAVDREEDFWMEVSAALAAAEGLGDTGEAYLNRLQLENQLLDSRVQTTLCAGEKPSQQLQAVFFDQEGEVYAKAAENGLLSQNELFGPIFPTVSGENEKPVFWDLRMPVEEMEKVGTYVEQNFAHSGIDHPYEISGMAEEKILESGQSVYWLTEVTVRKNTWVPCTEEEMKHYTAGAGRTGTGIAEFYGLEKQEEVYSWKQEEAFPVKAETGSSSAGLTNMEYYFMLRLRKDDYRDSTEFDAMMKERSQDDFLQGAEIPSMIQDGTLDTSAGMAQMSRGFFRRQSYAVSRVEYLGTPYYLYISSVRYPLWEAVRNLKVLYLYSIAITAAAALFCGVWMVRMQNKRQRLEDDRKQFTNLLAHELKTPLAIIENFSENALEEENAGKRQHYLEQIVSQTGQADEIIRRIVILSELENEKLPVLESRLDIRELYQKERDRFLPAIEEKGLVLSEEISSCILPVNERLFSQVIGNLLSNAVSYTPAGGEIRVNLTSDHFCVENTGSHLSEEEQKHLFDRYYHGKDRGEEKGHLGIGLYLVKEIAKRYHMNIKASNVPCGVRFELQFRCRQ